MKEYPLTKDELQSLAAIGILATLCFSLAAGAFGFWVNVSMSEAMSGTIDPGVKATWDTLKTAAIIGSPVLAAAGLAFLVLGGVRVHGIMKETTHG